MPARDPLRGLRVRLAVFVSGRARGSSEMAVDTIHVRCGTIPSLKRAWWSWGTLSAVGLGIIALPDLGPRLFSLSPGHGPSLLDLIGIVALVAGWAVLDVATWQRRRSLPLTSETWAVSPL